MATLRGMTLGHQGWIELCSNVDWLCERRISRRRGCGRPAGPQGFHLRQADVLGRAGPSRADGTSPWPTGRSQAMDGQARPGSANQMEKGWSKERSAFVQAYDSQVLDASNLLMPLVGFIAPRDPMWLSTLDAMR